MGLRIGGDGNFEIGDPFQAFDEVDRVRVAARVRGVTLDFFRRVAAQRHDMPDPGFPIAAGNVIDLVAGGGDAGEVGGGFQVRLVADAGHRLVGALAGATASPVGHRDEARMKRRQAQDGGPELGRHFFRLRREEL